MRHFGFVVVMLVAACSGKGESTTPQKMADYTKDNIRESVKTAPETARRAGKRITKAVDDPGEAIAGDGAGGESEGEGDAPAEGGDEASEE